MLQDHGHTEITSTYSHLVIYTDWPHNISTYGEKERQETRLANGTFPVATLPTLSHPSAWWSWSWSWCYRCLGIAPGPGLYISNSCRKQKQTQTEEKQYLAHSFSLHLACHIFSRNSFTASIIFSFVSLHSPSRNTIHSLPVFSTLSSQLCPNCQNHLHHLHPVSFIFLTL